MILTLLLGFGGTLGWGLLGTWAQAAGTRFSDFHSPRPAEVWETEATDTSGDLSGRNWCPYQKSRLVTFVAPCKTERFLVRSQQPCPQGAPDCQSVKVMYRAAHKPVYQVKQKVLISTAWGCCPGFQGPDCRHRDATATPAPPETSGLREPWKQLAGSELDNPSTELIEVPQEQLEPPLRDLQNDVHQGTDGLPGSWEAQAGSHTAVTTEVNQTDLEFASRTSERLRGPQNMDTFLQAHFNPIWKSFNESLHGLSQAIRNLSLDVEANQLAIKTVQEGTVARPDFQELGAKFEAKVQENSQRVSQLLKDVEDRLLAQQRSLHHTFVEVQADMDTKLKRLLKAQDPPGANGSLVVASAARPEPESLQARLGQLQRNLSALHMATSHREEELQGTLRDMRATLTRHMDEIKELYSESDETFDQISKVERQVEELQVNHTALRELRVILMEKSLIMEENKEELERQLLELNLTLQHLQGGQADLIKYVKDCNCQKLYFDLDAIREGQRDATRALEETQVSLDERRQSDGTSLQALQSAVDALSSAMDTRGAEGERARAERAQIRTQLRALERALGALKAAANQTLGEMGQLHGNFESLLQDALRHEAVLASLFGEDVMEEIFEEGPRPLPLTYEQIRVALLDAASGLQEQAQGWDALATRVEALEQAAAAAGGHAESPRLAEQLEPSRDAGREEVTSAAWAGLEQELQRLSSDVKRVGQCCEAPGVSSLNSSLEALHSALSETQNGLERHQRLFHSLFGNFQGLMAANVSLDLDKLQAVLSRKGKKLQKGLEAARKRDKKQVVASADAPAQGQEQGALGLEFWKPGSLVAFYATFSEETAALQTVRFNTASINVGGGYSPEHGHFRAPEHGVYLFVVTVTFGPGPGMGQLVFGGHRRVPVYSSAEQRAGNTATAFAMVELQKGERAWFELTQGSVAKRSPPGTAFGGFLMFKT
uniref:multimerin-2 n=1 Tax=Jaculus jaculus TaxID=51337 RepID=UPI001E1B3EE4|nr:multimerin-2 [Jaculus jaculus]